jgi:hypothetical protein
MSISQGYGSRGIVVSIPCPGGMVPFEWRGAAAALQYYRTGVGERDVVRCHPSVFGIRRLGLG